MLKMRLANKQFDSERLELEGQNCTCVQIFNKNNKIFEKDTAKSNMSNLRLMQKITERLVKTFKDIHDVITIQINKMQENKIEASPPNLDIEEENDISEESNRNQHNPMENQDQEKNKQEPPKQEGSKGEKMLLISEQQNEQSPSKKKINKRTKKPQTNLKPKKPQNSFRIFLAQMKKGAQNQQDAQAINEITKQASKRWQNMSGEQKKSYVELEQKELEEYNKKLQQYYNEYPEQKMRDNDKKQKKKQKLIEKLQQKNKEKEKKSKQGESKQKQDEKDKNSIKKEKGKEKKQKINLGEKSEIEKEESRKKSIVLQKKGSKKQKQATNSRSAVKKTQRGTKQKNLNKVENKHENQQKSQQLESILKLAHEGNEQQLDEQKQELGQQKQVMVEQDLERNPLEFNFLGTPPENNPMGNILTGNTNMIRPEIDRYLSLDDSDSLGEDI